MWANKSSSTDRDFSAHLNRHAPTVYAASKSLQTILGLSGLPVPFTPPPPPPTSIRVLPEQQELFQVQKSVDVKNKNRGSSQVQVSLESEGRDRHSTSKEIDEGAAFSRVQVFERRRVTNTTESEDETDAGDDDAAQRLAKRSMRPASPNSYRKVITQLNGSDDEIHTLSFPTITITTPAGEKRPCTALSTETPIPPLAKKRRQEKNSPKPPASLQCSLISPLPSYPFPSYPYSLTSTLMGWYHALEHSQLFRRHIPLLSRPRNLLVVCVSFWSTETVPPRELMRLEPGDAEMVRWYEVDTFCEVGGGGATRPFSLFKPSMPSKTLTPGRWTFLTVKEHPYKNSHSPSPSEPAEVDVVTPWHTIAFPTSSITKMEEELVQLARQSLAMPTSDAASGLANPYRSTDYAPGVPTTGSASASAASEDASSTPAAPTASLPPSKTPLTLCRTVLHLSKAGYVPLVESHGADTRPWTDFCNAVGKGKGRIMAWTEV